ncbi:MAG: hypothetical protein J6386_00475 [Candidatus Synoicihabitans palmerolidicus]|nr:hypothetical protein [Candidatus Synoicihabitans palmerolidicus]
MLKRILTITLGMAVGSLIALGLLHWVGMLGLGPAPKLDDSSEYYREVLALVEENYVEGGKVESDELTRAALEGMLRSLDPHSDFMRARDYSNLQEDLDSEFGGIGVQIEGRDGDVVVIAPIAGTPGERAGILREDVVK